MTGRAVAAGLLSLSLLFSAATVAARPRSWSAASGPELEAGTLEGTAIDEQGRLVLAPRIETLWGPESGIVWDVAAVPDGGAFVGLSSPARVLRLARNGDPEVWFEGDEESLVASLLPDGKGGIWFGLSPGGRLYHAQAAGEAREVAVCEGEFLWALEAGPRGSVWIGTGQPGQVLEWRPGAEPRLVYEAGDDPVRSLLVESDGSVLVGTAGEGRVLRLDPRGKPFVLHDADEPEIVSLVSSPGGDVYALAARGAKQAPSMPPNARGPIETVRVVASADGGDTATAEGEPSGDASSQRVVPQRFSIPAGAALYRITSEGDVRRLWESSSEVPFTLAEAGEDGVFIATGDRGRVWRIDPRGRAAVHATVASEQVSALTKDAKGALLIGGTTDARVERSGPGLAERGTYETPVIDARALADWGRVGRDAQVPAGAQLGAWIRAGNTAEPDATWSDWVEVEAATGEHGRLPPARWAQVRFELQPSPRGESPSVGRIELFYNTRNREPVIEDLSIEPPGVAWTRNPVQAMQPAGPAVADDPIARETVDALAGPRMARPIRKSYELGARTVTWRASDPDGDELQYRLEVGAVGSDVWVLLGRDIGDEFAAFDTRGLPDGTYRVRLTVNDGRDNPGAARLADQQISRTFTVDNTRPSLRDASIRRGADGHAVRFVAQDTAGRVASVEIAVDDGGWQPIDPLDGVADSSEETYETIVAPAPPERALEDGSRTLRVRVTDSAGNLGGDAWSLE